MECQMYGPYLPMQDERKNKSEISLDRWFQCRWFALHYMNGSIAFTFIFLFDSLNNPILQKTGWEDITVYLKTNSSPRGDVVFLPQNHQVENADSTALKPMDSDFLGIDKEICTVNNPSDSYFTCGEALESGTSFHALAWRVRITKFF